MHIPKERFDFAVSDWMKSENLAAKQRTFRGKRVILLLAWCGEKVHFPGAKNYTFRWKRVILPIACCGEKDFKKCTIRRKRMILLAAACLLVAKCGF